MAEEFVVAVAEWLTSAGYLGAADAVLTYGVVALEVAAAAASVYTTQQQQRRAQNDQRDQYNASLRDRYVMSRGATEPRQLVLGRQRVSGPIFFLQSYGANREHLVMCVALAAHEIDAVEAIYFDDEQVLLDGSNNVVGVNRRETFSLSGTGGAFALQATPKTGTVTAAVKYGTTSVSLGVSVSGATVTVSGATAGQTGTLMISYQPATSAYASPVGTTDYGVITLDGSGNGTVTLPVTPITGSVNVIVPGIGDTPDGDITSFTAVAGAVVTVTGAVIAAGRTVYVNYQLLGNFRARIRTYLGGAGQAADSAMISNLPGVWTSAHTATGIAYLVVELEFDPDAFPHGLPNISATVRGAKVYDPRTGTTAWSENPALLMRHAATHPLCGRLPASAVNDAAVIVAANVCDVSTAYMVNGQTYTRARYTVGSVVRSGTRGQDVLTDLAQAMGGKWAFIEGQLKVRAGAYVTPLQTLDETWLSGTSAVQVQPRANRADVFNVITGKFADETSDYQVLDVPRVASSAYITEDGAELPMNLQLNAVTFTGQAQQLEAQQMRDARQGLRVSLSCNMRADAVEWGDFLTVNMARFGWVGKVFEVLDTSYTLDGGIALTLKETSSTIWDLGTSFAATDPAPNTFLPSPFNIASVQGITVDSSNAVQVRASDGTVLQRMRVSWTAITDQGVLASGGGVEVRYGRAGQAEAQWTSAVAEGSSTLIDIVNVQPGQLYLVKARAFNALVNGPWSTVVKHTVGTRSIAIDTPQLVASSATEIYTADAAGPVSVTQRARTPNGFGFNTQVLSITFTPGANGIATIHLDAYADFANGSASTSYFEYGLWDAGAAFTGIYAGSESIASSQTVRLNVAATRTFAVTGGVSYTFAVYARIFVATDVASMTNVHLRAEVIKR